MTLGDVATALIGVSAAFLLGALMAWTTGGRDDVGKRSKRNRQPERTAGSSAGVSYSALATALANLRAEGLGFAELIANQRRDPFTRRVWAVEASRQCCRLAARDGAAVTVPSEEAEALRLASGGDAAMRRIMLGLYSAHEGGRSLSAVLDVEDARRLVNHLLEAIALVDPAAGDDAARRLLQ